jgi:hypothetical protein
MKHLATKIYATLLVVILGLPTIVLALSAEGIGGYPANPDSNVPFSESWFIYNLDLGESKDDAITVFTTSEEAQVAKIYVVDSAPSQQGNFSLAADVDPKKDVGAWVDLEEQTITLEPGIQYTIPFTITVPEDADVGEHSGGIVLERVGSAEEVEEGDPSQGASIVTRVGIRIYQTVPGEITRNLEIEDFNVTEVENKDGSKYYRADISVFNNSNVSLRPIADLNIGGWGKIEYPKFKDISVNTLGDFFTGETLSKEWQLFRDQRVDTNWQWPVPRFGFFTFQTTLTYETDEGPVVIKTDKKSMWSIPVLELSIIAGFILLLIILIILIKLYFSGRKWKKYTVKKGDQLVLIAQKSKVSWKRLAKVNKLKSPLLKEGTVILVPKSYGDSKVLGKSDKNKKNNKNINEKGGKKFKQNKRKS